MEAFERHTITGTEYRRIAAQFFSEKRGKFGRALTINSLHNWMQQIRFRNEKSDLLSQIYGGPCGVFAVIQAYIIKLRQMPENINSSQIDILNEALLSIMECISDEYSFCVDVNPDQNSASFVTLLDRGQAFLWLCENSYTLNGRSVLLFSFGLTYLARNKDWFGKLPEPFVLEDASTSMAFVWLMLTGHANDIDVSSFKHQTEIGVRVIGNRDKRVNGTHLNPGASIFVIHKKYHYFCAIQQGQSSIVYDPFAKTGIKTVKTEAIM